MYKTIVVHLDCGKRRSERLHLAISIAEEFGAYLIGAFALAPIHTQSYAEAEAAPIIKSLEQRQRADAEHQAAREFRQTVGSRVAGSEWRLLRGDPVTGLAELAYYADLVVVGQHDTHKHLSDGVPDHFADDVVMAAGKPVLIVPYAGHFPSIGRRSFIAWKPTREASRAVWGALPLLQRSDAVEVGCFEDESRASSDGDVERLQLARYLEFHGIEAKVTMTPVSIDAGYAILSRAAEFGADSITMGAYGHSRVREAVFGGATRTVLDHMTVPVIMAH